MLLRYGTSLLRATINHIAVRSDPHAFESMIESSKFHETMERSAAYADAEEAELEEWRKQ